MCTEVHNPLCMEYPCVWIPQNSVNSALSLGGASSLFLHFPWTGQSCVQVVQHFDSSTLFPGRAAPCERTVVPHYLGTFSGQASPAGGYHSILELHILSQWVHEAAPQNTHWIFLLVEGLPVHMLWRPPVTAGSHSRRMGGDTVQCPAG